MKSKIEQLTEFHYFEILDRSAIITHSFYENVHEHPAVEHNQELKEEAEKTINQLQNFLNLCGDFMCRGHNERTTSYIEGE